jgi:hypothetical protein
VQTELVGEVEHRKSLKLCDLYYIEYGFIKHIKHWRAMKSEDGVLNDAVSEGRSEPLLTV